MTFALSTLFPRKLPVILLSIACASGYASTDKQIITLTPPAGQPSSIEAVRATGALRPQTATNFRDFGSLESGQTAHAEPLDLRFAAETRLLSIKSTADFTLEQGGSCTVGNVYKAGTACRLLVRFTPQGGGYRAGHVTIQHTASVVAENLGLGGYSYLPAVSFVPAISSTVPASVSGGTGLLNNALDLSIDGGDTLYIADTGNNLIRSYDSSGKFTTISSGGLSAPQGVVADPFGEVYFTEPAANLLYEIYAYGLQFQLSGSTSATCTVAAPCNVSSEKVFSPGTMATDGYGRMFFVDGYFGAAEFVAQSQSASYAHLYDPFTFQATTPGVIAVDTSDNIYSFWYNGSVCAIAAQNFSNAANTYSVYQKVAGGKTCGFAGDGGQARNAEIGKNVSQMAFDAAGNLYFTDTTNARVRRIDNLTGIIRTVAGNGTTSNGGDGGPSTSATLSTPTGVAVDSTGAVYVISRYTTSSTRQVIRKFGPDGLASFGSVSKSASATKLINMANSGNSALNITGYAITGSNASDFSLDTGATSCNLASGNSLNSGTSCQISIRFKPSATGSRSATLALFDNSAATANYIQLKGTGTSPSPAMTILAPVAETKNVAGKTVKFSVGVTSTSGSAPTGNVTFKVDGATVGSVVPLSSGAASVNLTGLTAKTHTLSATYNDDSHYAADSVSESIIVKATAVAGQPVHPGVD